MIKIPPCKGYETREGDYDCEYEYGNTCEECLCNWYTTSGTFDPVIGKYRSYKKCVKDLGVYQISYCDSCNCMTKTISKKCGKCGANKND